jgi:hypothetical protein
MGSDSLPTASVKADNRASNPEMCAALIFYDVSVALHFPRIREAKQRYNKV